MIQTSLAKRMVLMVAGGLMSCFFATAPSSAAEIKVLTSVALTSVLNELAPKFEQATGNKLDIGYSLIADIRKRMLDGETADVIILSRSPLDRSSHDEAAGVGATTTQLGNRLKLSERDAALTNRFVS